MAGRTLLADYLERSGQSLEEFGKKIGATAGMVSRYAQSKRYPTTRYAVAIETETKGEVPVSYWAGLETKRAGPSKVQKTSRTPPGRRLPEGSRSVTAQRSTAGNRE